MSGPLTWGLLELDATEGPGLVGDDDAALGR